MKRALSPAETADLIDRFIRGKELYPQEWNDFVEALKVEPAVEDFRKRCYELDPLVNRPGGPDLNAMEELKELAFELHHLPSQN